MRLENFFCVRVGYGIQILDLGLYLEKYRTLVIADLHIGYEEALNKQGILLPRFQFRETVARLKRILDSAKPKRVIINGDLKHEFGGISAQEWRETLKVLDLILTCTDDVVLVKGNHDMIKKQGSRSSSVLMGMAMKSLRGKVSGEKINKLLEMKISKILEE